MKILSNYKYQNNNINFKAGLTTKHLEFIKTLNPNEITQKLYKQNNIKCNFNDNELIAGLCEKTVDIFSTLNRKHPPSLNAIKFQDMGPDMPNKWTTAYTIFSKPNNGLLGRINFNTRIFGKTADHLELYDYCCTQAKEHAGSNHVLQAFIHEFIHSEQFIKLKDKIGFEDIKNMKMIKYIPLWEEIVSKTGYYSATNPLEFYANYWSREICESLDGNWQPKYNPFETPKIQLSTKLQDFLNAVEEFDYKKAEKIANSSNNSTITLFKKICDKFKIFTNNANTDS